METRTVYNPPPAAPHDDAGRCVLAIELSKKSWIVAVNTPLSEKISRHTSEACDWKELLELCERIRTRIARELKKDVELVFMLRSGLRRLLASPSARSTRHTQLCHRSGKSAG